MYMMSQNINLTVRHHSLPQHKQILPCMRLTNVKPYSPTARLYCEINQQSNVQQTMQIMLDYNKTATFQRLSDQRHRCRLYSCRLVRGVNDSAADRPYLSSASHLLISTGQNESTFPLSLDSQATTSHMWPWLTWPTQLDVPIRYKHAYRWPAYLNCTGQRFPALN